MSPLNFSYYISPSVERYHHLFMHEYTHVVMGDKYNSTDLGWRKFLGGKFLVDSNHPFSALFSYIGTPRWYAPRWYHEGIACFMETWMGGGSGRALGGYDEMNFRSLVYDNKPLYSVVGLETEGTTQDFQIGTNSYLYGTRFVNYLVYEYGLEKLIKYYNRTEDSKTLFNRQFKDVYGESLRNVWESWKSFEVDHQRENLGIIAEYPVTDIEMLTDKPLGSASPPLYDRKNNCLYSAVNYPGKMPHLARIDINTGKETALHLIDGPQLYQTSYVAFDSNNERLFYTTHNTKYRGLNIYDLKKGRVTKRLKIQRVSNIVYDNATDRLYGVFTNAGIDYLIRFDAQLENKAIIYPFNFGQSVFDIDVSHDGRWLTATVSGLGGEQTLLRFDVEGLKNADFSCDTLMTAKDYNFGQFRFSEDDSCLVGSSYYTGVSNLWSYNNTNGDFNLLSNVETGLFAPYQYSSDSLFAFQFSADGMIPVKLKKEIIHDANAIKLLGQKAYEKNSRNLESLGEFLKPLPETSFSDVYNKITSYQPLNEMRFLGAYPEISAFADKESIINVTPVLGYRFAFQDPVGLSSIKFSLGISPWSSNPWKNRFHADFLWQYWQFKLAATWNKTDFYDFFGPLRTSRRGYSVSLSYDIIHSLNNPFTWEWGASIATFGDMDVLPLYQNIPLDEGVKSLQIATAHISASKTRGSLGSVMREQGYNVGLDAYTYYAGGKFYPSVSANLEGGVLLPFMRNTSFWLRSYFGQSFGDTESSFGNEYFGGFRNNYVDYRDSYRFRTLNAMPGAEIDAISAHRFAKLMAELNLKPIRFNNFGALNFYPTYAQVSLFATDLLANPFMNNDVNYFNYGAQVNIEVVLFKYLKTTWSVGYARLHSSGIEPGSQWMVSLKLL